MSDGEHTGRHVVIFGCFLAAALGAMFYLPGLGVFLAMICVITGFAVSGHHVLSRLLDIVFRGSGFSQRDISKAFQRDVESFLRAGQVEQAQARCREWIRRDDGNAAPHLMMCRITADWQGDVDAAIQRLEGVILRRFSAEDHAALARQLADLYRRAGRPNDIEALFERVRAAHPRSREIDGLR